MLWDGMIGYLKGWFIYTGLEWDLILIGIALAIVFGAIWVLGYWPPLFKKHWLWVVAVVGAFFTLLALVFVQLPLRYYIGQAMTHFWSQEVIIDWLLLTGIPQMLLSGLVQEGAKMLPIVVWWWRCGRNIDPKLGIAIGAMAGLGFGVFEAVQAHCSIFAFGWTWQAIESEGFLAIAGFWERFFAIGFHMGVSALAGYGLAKGKGWQFYLIVAGVHTLLNYGIILLYKDILTLVQLEVCVAVLALIITAIVLLIRWRKPDEGEEVEEIDEIDI